ncbi:B12-binding domain-containing radical SAM protein [Nitrospina watsonii]|uniref:B12-binding domain-containing protein n=1 Tax=Nitrospina watsonii TaxID=1323948 RepID=A0ABM9HA86_9BACT|nr:radical SAM protein [Nitrospina watsonii]CAI2717043.1 B12-binding domain-containing protein [Nitrospina watsonii]
MLFINPAYEKFGGMLSRYIPVGIPVSLGVISAYLRKYGVKNIRVVDEEIETITQDNFRKFVEGLEQPLIIGITVLTSQAGRAYNIGRMYKEAYPDCTVIMGGVHVTALPEEALRNGSADIVVRGEGEETMRQLYHSLREGGDAWQKIRGITFLDEEDELVSNPDNDLIDNLDDVPIFPYELFEHPKYDMGFLTGARGCPYKCSYCSQRILTGLTYRWHSMERIIENVKILVNKYKIENITFYDDIFSVNKRRVIELCDGIVEAGLHEKCAFAVQTRADNIHEDILPAMKRANFKTIGMGMETGVERIAKEANKDQTVEQHLDAVALCKKYGFKVSLFMIYGFPGESKADRDESWRVVNGANVGFVKFNNLIPYPGTPIYDEAQREGRLHIMEGWRNFNSTLSITRSIFDTIPLAYVPKGVTEFELKRDIIRRNLQYYFQWKIVKSILTRDKGVGWIALPPNWFLKPREVAALTGMALILGSNLLFSLLPPFVGNAVFALLKRGRSEAAPKDIKMKDRKFRRSRLPKGAEAEAPEPAAMVEGAEGDDKARSQKGRAEWLGWSSPS